MAPLTRETLEAQRHVYRPPEGRRGAFMAVVIGSVMTALIFLAIPFSQLVEGMIAPKAPVLKEVFAEAPPEMLDLTPPPDLPEEEPEEEPPPEMEEETDPLDVDLFKGLSLEVGLGGGFLDEALGNFAVEQDSLGDLFNMDALDQQPQAVFQAPPRYPRELQRSRVSGVAIVKFIIDEQGNVVNPEIEKSTDSRFDEAAVEAVRKWRFKPGTKAGRSVKTTTRIPIEFQMK
ncbi:MAG TPA: energy transducer TonB [Verrucomicrobiales bacterium]|nr:energy transducer TonB [Verrucomicrobiales bacterium]